MKKIFWATAIIIPCMIIACKESPSTTASMSQSEKNKEISNKVNRAIETGDLSKLDSFIDKDVVDHSGPNGEIRGLDSLKKFFTEMHEYINDLKIESFANATDGDYNFDLNRTTGTTNHAFMGMPANTKLDMTGVDVVKMRNGKAAEHWGYVDPRDMMKMMENMKMAPGAENKMDTGKMKR